MRRLAPLLLLTAVPACHADVPAGDGLRLSTGAVEVPAGVEGMYCWSLELADAIPAIVGFSSRTGPGVHHVAVFVDHRATAPAAGPCEPFDPAWEMIYTAGGGDGALTLPPGVGFTPLSPRLLLQGHFVNVTDRPMRTEIDVALDHVEPDTVEPAALFVLGTTEVQIPPGARDHVVTTRCEAPPEATFAYAFPHMHERGRRFRLAVSSSPGVETTLLDERWGLDHQVYVPFEPAYRSDGRALVLDCHYDNPSDRELRYGASASDEMCQVAIVAHPMSARRSCFETR